MHRTVSFYFSHKQATSCDKNNNNQSHRSAQDCFHFFLSSSVVCLFFRSCVENYGFPIVSSFRWCLHRDFRRNHLFRYSPELYGNEFSWHQTKTWPEIQTNNTKYMDFIWKFRLTNHFISFVFSFGHERSSTWCLRVEFSVLSLQRCKNTMSNNGAVQSVPVVCENWHLENCFVDTQKCYARNRCSMKIIFYGNNGAFVVSLLPDTKHRMQNSVIKIIIIFEIIRSIKMGGKNK